MVISFDVKCQAVSMKRVPLINSNKQPYQFDSTWMVSCRYDQIGSLDRDEEKHERQ